MNEYIFYTTEGYTIAPNENVKVENCQLLGRACGNTMLEAKKKLMEDNPWIIEAGFHETKFIIKQLLT